MKLPNFFAATLVTGAVCVSFVCAFLEFASALDSMSKIMLFHVFDPYSWMWAVGATTIVFTIVLPLFVLTLPNSYHHRLEKGNVQKVALQWTAGIAVALACLGLLLGNDLSALRALYLAFFTWTKSLVLVAPVFELWCAITRIDDGISAVHTDSPKQV